VGTRPGHVPPIPWAYASEIAQRLRSILSDRLAGLYLHGSAALGGWNPEQSDVDLLGVSTETIGSNTAEAIAAALTELEAPGKGLEFSLVTLPSLAGISPRPPFELHVATGADARVVSGAGHPGDADLVLHYAVCRARGVTVCGPQPGEVFPDIPRALALMAMLDELSWGLDHAPARYAVLNACRAWAFAEGKGILSKIEGGLWAIETGRHGAVARAVLAPKLHGMPRAAMRAAAAGLVRDARAALTAAIVAEG
jgi:predicted nucleotidyltransferase